MVVQLGKISKKSANKQIQVHWLLRTTPHFLPSDHLVGKIDFPKFILIIKIRTGPNEHIPAGSLT